MSIDAVRELKVPPKYTGLRHPVAATRYSLAGLRYLPREPAFRHEFAFGALIHSILAYRGASLAA